MQGVAELIEIVCFWDQLPCSEVSSANLERSYRRAPRGAAEARKHLLDPPGICHLCMAGTKGCDWEDLILVLVHLHKLSLFSCQPTVFGLRTAHGVCFQQMWSAVRKMTEGLIMDGRCLDLPLPWSNEPAWTRLMHDESIGGLQRFHRIDVWHTLHMGVGKAWVSSTMHLLQHVVPGGSVDKRMEFLNEDFFAFCSDHGKTRYLRRIDALTFGLKGKEPTAGWNKAHVTATLMQWMEDFMRRNRDMCMAMEDYRFVAAWLFCSHFWFDDLGQSCCPMLFRHPVLSQIEASATAAMNRFMAALHHAGIWLPKNKAMELVQDGRHFVYVYVYMAHKSLGQGKLLYPLLPKLHMLQHLMEELEWQSSRAQWVWNILADACYMEEDFVGRLSYLTRCVSPRAQALRAIQRYLVQLNICCSMP